MSHICVGAQPQWTGTLANLPLGVGAMEVVTHEARLRVHPWVICNVESLSFLVVVRER